MAISNLSAFAQLVTRYRQQNGMSQGQLAQATRLSRTYIYQLETGMRCNPSPHVAQSIARALELQGEERRQLYNAFTNLTGQQIDDEQPESELLDFGELAELLVHNTSYPAHSLDRLWLRTTTTVFTSNKTYSMVSYVPGDQHTLEIYRKYKWQPE